MPRYRSIAFVPRRILIILIRIGLIVFVHLLLLLLLLPTLSC